MNHCGRKRMLDNKSSFNNVVGAGIKFEQHLGLGLSHRHRCDGNSNKGDAIGLSLGYGTCKGIPQSKICRKGQIKLGNRGCGGDANRDRGWQ